MTRERAVEILKRKTTIPNDGETIADIEEAFDMAIEALEQESCEDTISRKAIKSKLIQLWNSGGDIDYCMETLRDFINEEPSVTPIRPKGHWSMQKLTHKCTNCGYITGSLSCQTWDFCPNYGAKMESEE